jgi:hypothetical protein
MQLHSRYTRLGKPTLNLAQHARDISSVTRTQRRVARDSLQQALVLSQ